MKVKFHQIMKKSRSIFNLIFIFSLAANIQAQSQKTFTKEIDVKKGVNISTNVPTDFYLSCDGTVTTDNTKDRFIISGKDGDQRLNISKELNVYTWDKQVVKQEVMVNAHLESNEAAKRFLTALDINFKEKANDKLKIDANMNFKSFEMNNGFFKSDECIVTLDDGSDHKVNRLEIQTTLYIPKDANLSVEGKRNCTIILDDLEGELELILSYAEVYGKKANRIKGNLNYCYNAIFDQVNHAEINAINSHVKINKVEKLEIGKEKISNRCLAPSMKKLKRSNSFQNIFNIGTVETVEVYETANDEINIDEVSFMNVAESAFSQFQIDQLNRACDLKAKNSEVKIMKVHQDFNKINMTNELGEIYLRVDEGANYRLNMPADNYLECDLDSKFIRVESKEGEECYQVGKDEEQSSIYINCDRCKFSII